MYKRQSEAFDLAVQLGIVLPFLVVGVSQLFVVGQTVVEITSRSHVQLPFLAQHIDNHVDVRPGVNGDPFVYGPKGVTDSQA